METALKKTRYENILKAQDMINTAKTRMLTQEEIAELKTLHTGEGGLYIKKEGQKYFWDQYFTPRNVAEFMVGLLGDYIKGDRMVLETSCGSGVFLDTLLYKNPKLNITALDIDKNLTDICKVCYPSANIIHGDALDYVEEFENKMDLVIGNPPYSVYTKKNGYEVFDTMSCAFFLQLSIRALKKDGLAVLLIPTNIGMEAKYVNLRHWIRKHTNQLARIDLPRETFWLYGTSVPTSVVIFQKKSTEDERPSNVFRQQCTFVGWDRHGKPLEKVSDDQVALEDIRKKFKVFKKNHLSNTSTFHKTK